MNRRKFLKLLSAATAAIPALPFLPKAVPKVTAKVTATEALWPNIGPHGKFIMLSTPRGRSPNWAYRMYMHPKQISHYESHGHTLPGYVIPTEPIPEDKND